MVESNSAKDPTTGKILEADRVLRSTAERRIYEGFTAFLNAAGQQAHFRGPTPPFRNRGHQRACFIIALSSTGRHT